MSKFVIQEFYTNLKEHLTIFKENNLYFLKRELRSELE